MDGRNKAASTGGKPAETLGDGGLQLRGTSSNISRVLQMKRTCLIPSVTALACADTAALPGYTPLPPPRPFTHEYARGISRGSKTLLSDSLL